MWKLTGYPKSFPEFSCGNGYLIVTVLIYRDNGIVGSNGVIGLKAPVDVSVYDQVQIKPVQNPDSTAKTLSSAGNSYAMRPSYWHPGA
jgi:hypothetical protein